MLPQPPGSPLLGKYLVRRPAVNLLLRAVDRLLALAVPKGSTALPRGRRILLANGAHLGDVLLASAAVPVLKAAFPGCRVGFLIGSWAEVLLRDQPLVDDLHIVDHWKLNRAKVPLRRKLVRYHDTRRRALHDVRRARYDLAIDLYPYFPNSIPFLYQAGIPARIGYTSGGFGPLLTHALDWIEGRHVLEDHAALLRLVVPEDALRCLAPLDPGGCVSPQISPSSYVVLHMGTGNARKEWPAERWRALAKRLIAVGHSLVFTGSGAAEDQNIERVVAGLENCTNVCGRLSWREYVEVIRRARLLIGVDSVAGHVAAAIGTPCVIVASGITPPGRWRPWGQGHRVLTRATPCAPCHRANGCEGMECVREVSVDEVMAAVAGALTCPQARSA